MNALFLYQTLSRSKTELSCVIDINPNHAVFRGHFPDRPVMPGVCMIQMMVDAFTQQENEKVELRAASMIKFVNLWLPDQNDEVQMHISYERLGPEIKIKNCTISTADLTFFKFKGRLYASE